MSRKGHRGFTLGIFCILVSLFGFDINFLGVNVDLLTAYLTIQLGDMFVDLDSKSSVQGQVLQKVAVFILCTGIGIMFYSCYLLMTTGVWNILSLYGILSVLVFILLKDLKHRGFLHSIYIPLFICLSFLTFKEDLQNIRLASLLFGFVFGIIAHLMADTTTEYGVYPFRLPFIKIPIIERINIRIPFLPQIKESTINIFIFIFCSLVIGVKFGIYLLVNVIL